MKEFPPLDQRINCPCCGYPTLAGRANYEICELCNWEDDGQDDEDADEVWGGPNSDYSLTEARKNFRLQRVMYEPGRDQRIGQGDSQLVYEAKGGLMAAFELLRSGAATDQHSLQSNIMRLERLLFDDVVRTIRAYEQKNSGS